MTASGRKNQVIFINKPLTDLIADATTADANLNFWFKTIANTVATAFTDFTNAVNGPAYILECGSLTNATTIAKSGKFADITAEWTPTAVGDYLMVVLNGAGDKFLDLERRVGGTRTINSLLQPNVTTV